jgi:MYXO-CTERM domain-containing protein
MFQNRSRNPSQSLLEALSERRRLLIIAVVVALVIVGALLLPTAAPAQLVRGPYLQQTTPTSVRVKWRTASATDSAVRFGLSAQNLTENASASTQTTDHEVLVDGLQPQTRYYYSVKTDAADWAGGSGYYFETAPSSHQSDQHSTRIWVLGDSGTANSSARAVRESYLDWANNEAPDVWLMLGDNAYPDGTDAQYQDAVFEMYPTMLRRVALWSTLGNHDGHSATSADLQGPYYDIFSLPKNAEAGGVASGTEAYYSFDYANIHFVCLDSYDTDRSANGAMANWLRDDLSATTQPWIIAFFHHPPYTKGSHNSDTEGRLIDMRQNLLPILEEHGVDLVLSGHSHSYERSFLIDGHYGDSTTFSNTHLVDDGDGRADGDGAYRKEAGPNLGAVYAVPGSSGKLGGGSLDHPAMFIGLHELGSMSIDVRGHRLEATFLNSDGVAADHFTIEKGSDQLPPEVVDVTALSETEVEVTFDEPVEQTSATDPLNWDINGDVDVLSASPSAAGTRVTLTTETLERNMLYELTITGLADLHQNALAAPIVREFALADVESMSFRDGQLPTDTYAGTADTKLKSDDPTTNFGADEQLEADGSPEYGVLLRWDVSALPEDVTVLAAELSLEITGVSSQAYDIVSVLRDWREQEASWENYRTGQAWQQAGARGDADSDTQSLGAVMGIAEGPEVTPLTQAGLALIEQWIADPSTNHGVLVAAYGSATDGVDFLSSETATAGQRPMLTVQYRPELRRAPDDTVEGTADAGGAQDSGDSSDTDIPDSDSTQPDTDAPGTSDIGADSEAPGPMPTSSEGGCACRSASGSPEPYVGAAFLVLLAGARLLRRRRL